MTRVHGQESFTWGSLTLLLAIALCGCGSPTPADGDADADGAPDADADVDADGDGDGDTDADVTGDADGPEPLRRLGERRLFGDMPLNNGFYDPQFSLLDTIGWSAAGTRVTFGEVTRVFLARTPMGQPALLVPFGGNPAGMTVVGAAKGARGPSEVSVWIGRVQYAEDPDLELITASFIGLYPGGRSDEAADLEPDDSTPPLELGDIRWRRFALRLPQGPIGWASLSVTQEGTDEDYYLSSPILVPLDAGGSGARLVRAPRDVPRRALRAAEINALELQRRAAMDRLR